MQDNASSFSASLPPQNAISMNSIKRYFKSSNGNLKTFSASWTTENETFLKSLSDDHVVEGQLKIIFCHLITPNFEFGEFEKLMFQVVARHWENIFFPLTTPKSDLGEFEKAMFHFFACKFELIIGLLTIQKCDLDKVEKPMFRGLP